MENETQMTTVRMNDMWNQFKSRTDFDEKYFDNCLQMLIDMNATAFDGQSSLQDVSDFIKDGIGIDLMSELRKSPTEIQIPFPQTEPNEQPTVEPVNLNNNGIEN